MSGETCWLAGMLLLFEAGHVELFLVWAMVACAGAGFVAVVVALVDY